MVGLINQILTTSKLEAGRLTPNLQTLDITALLAEKTAVFSPQAEINEKQIVCQVADDLPAPPADSDLISRVLDNLMSNALKYTTAGGCISLRATVNETAVLVQVGDDGEGIAPEMIVHIFDKFYQVKDAEGKPIRQGTGLGLAFCKLVIEAHHGQIWVESELGVGSTFSFTLPLQS